jgi:PAS domain-containing protein
MPEEVVRERTEELQSALHENERITSALREAEQKYRGIFENAIAGIFQSKPEGRFLSANPAMGS